MSGGFMVTSRRYFCLVCALGLVLGLGSNVPPVKADVSEEVRKNKAELDTKLRTELERKLTPEPGKRFALPAALLGPLVLESLDLAIKFIKEKKPDFNPTTED